MFTVHGTHVHVSHIQVLTPNVETISHLAGMYMVYVFLITTTDYVYIDLGPSTSNVLWIQGSV